MHWRHKDRPLTPALGSVRQELERLVEYRLLARLSDDEEQRYRDLTEIERDMLRAPRQPID